MTARPPLHVLLVEDHRPTLTLSTLALRAAGHHVVAASTLAVARAHLAAAPRLDVCVLDLALPDGDGLTLLPLLKRRAPPVAVVVLTLDDAPSRVLAALTAGADGYLVKEELGLRLVDAVAQALAGGLPMTRSSAGAVRQQVLQAQAAAPPCPLTPAERQVLVGFARGLGYDAVAEANAISINTVRTYVRSIYLKLNVASKTAAVLTALRAGWIAEP